MIVWQAHRARIRHMAFSPDGAELATTAGSSKFVWLWRAATGAAAGRLAGHTTYARAVAYSPDGRFIASTQNESVTRVWDRTSRAVVAHLETPGGWLETVTFRPDSSSVTVGLGCGLGEWRCADFDPSRPLPPSNRFQPSNMWAVQRVRYSPCGRFVSARSYQSCVVYNASDFATICALGDPQGSAEAAQFEFAPDGNSLAIVYGLRIHIRALPHGTEIAVLRGHPNFIHALGFMPDGRAVVSAGADGVVRVWDSTTGAETRSFDWGIGKVCAAAVSPDGMLCAAGGENGKIVVWDVDG
jgi:WD40 repeat protein